MELAFKLGLVLVEFIQDVLLVQALGVFGVQETPGSEQVLGHAVQVALTTSNLVEFKSYY